MYTYYQWKEPTLNEDGDPIRITPWSDPWRYEFPFDFMFDTPEDAKAGLADFDVSPEEYKDWVLVRVTEEVIEEADHVGI